MVVVFFSAFSLLRSTSTFTALLFPMAVVPDIGSAFTQSTSMPVISQFASPAFPVFFMSKVKTLFSIPKSSSFVLNSILCTFFSASAEIFNGSDSPFAFTIMVVVFFSAFSLLRSTSTFTALLFPMAVVPDIGSAFTQSTLMPVISQFASPAFPVFFISKVMTLFSTPKSKESLLNSIL